MTISSERFSPAAGRLERRVPSSATDTLARVPIEDVDVVAGSRGAHALNVSSFAGPPHRGTFAPPAEASVDVAPSTSLRARAANADVALLDDLRAVARSPVAVDVFAAQSHGVPRPRTASAAAPRGYSVSLLPSRSREDVRAEMALGARAVADLRERLSAAADDELVRRSCPHVAQAAGDPTGIAVAVVVDVFVLCPNALDAPELDGLVDDGCVDGLPSNPSPSGDLLAGLASALGFGLEQLAGLLTNPLVVDVLAPLLVQGLNLVVPGLGVALAPVLPIALPIVGQLLSGAGGVDANGLGDVVGAFASAVA
jgi:hypothetical protein